MAQSLNLYTLEARLKENDPGHACSLRPQYNGFLMCDANVYLETMPLRAGFAYAVMVSRSNFAVRKPIPD